MEVSTKRQSGLADRGMLAGLMLALTVFVEAFEGVTMARSLKR